MWNLGSNVSVPQGFEDCLMTDSEVARWAKVSVNTVRYWRFTGVMPYVKVGRHPRIWLSTIQRVFENPGWKGLNPVESWKLERENRG